MLKQIKYTLTAALAGLSLALSPIAAQAEHHGEQGCCAEKHAEKPKPKKYQHGQGRSLHQQWCVRCHGSITGEGLTGPNLTKSVANLTKEEFITIVTNGKSSGNGIMPAWKSNPRVMGGVEKLYDFLKAYSEPTS